MFFLAVSNCQSLLSFKLNNSRSFDVSIELSLSFSNLVLSTDISVSMAKSSRWVLIPELENLSILSTLNHFSYSSFPSSFFTTK